MGAAAACLPQTDLAVLRDRLERGDLVFPELVEVIRPGAGGLNLLRRDDDEPAVLFGQASVRPVEQAEKRRQETREWLLQRERASAAPSIVPDVPDVSEAPKENLRVEPKRSYSHSRR